MGFYHLDNRFYLGGGFIHPKFLAHFKAILPNGEVTHLQQMPTAKTDFAMTHWRQKNNLFTLGGRNRSRLKQVQEYSLSKNKWKFHWELLEAISGSSAVILNNVMYNIGGDKSSHPVMWCQLSATYPSKWKFMNISHYSLNGYYWREVLVVENKIVYFGASCKNATFVLEQEEGGEQLNGVRVD